MVKETKESSNHIPSSPRKRESSLFTLSKAKPLDPRFRGDDCDDSGHRATAVPRLRFPEFREAPPWNEEKLEKLIITVNPPAKLQSSSYLAAGKFPIIDQSQDLICGWTNDAEAVVKGSPPVIVFGDHTCALKFVEQPFAQGADGIKILKAKPEITIKYLFHSLNHRPLVMEDYKRHFSTLRERLVYFPDIKSGEQQKIADCLTSLDEVIAAQGRKVEALKAHKRGLMQQLFPRAGETRPRLRFPEFRNAPEWEECPLGACVDLLSGYPFDGKDIVEDSTGERLMRGINITEGAIRHNVEIDRYYRGPVDELEKFRMEQNDLVIGMDGSKVGKNSALIGVDDVSALLVQRVARLRARSLWLINFIFHQIHSPRFHAYVDRINTSSGIPHISASQIKEYPIQSTNEEEQQRIADCLSSLDPQITAESEKLAALKTHKRGLMQQLFPDPVGADPCVCPNKPVNPA